MRRVSKNKDKKVKKGDGDGDNKSSVLSVSDLPTRILLYMQPKDIQYPQNDVNVTVEIELTHPEIKVTALNEHYTEKNIIYLEYYRFETPTFSVTIKQDDIEDVNMISDRPLTLTLYENVAHTSISLEHGDDIDLKSNENEEKSLEEHQVIERIAVAQGYIDLLEFFTKRRSHSSCTTFLYPLPSMKNRKTCKIEWDVYSLHPLVKDLVFSNVVFLTLGSIYNLNDDIMDDCDDILLRLYFLSKIPNESGEYDKHFICSFNGFNKQIIGEQVSDNKWENLKDSALENHQCLGIRTDMKFDGYKLFQELLCPEGVELNMDEIDIATESCLNCNSVHRYILTSPMEKLLEYSLAENRQQLFVEVIRERDDTFVLLQGLVQLYVFMYPNVTKCNFAVELMPPGYTKPKPPQAREPKPKRGKVIDSPSVRSGSIDLPKRKVPFATLKICLNKPITEPEQDMIPISKTAVKYQIFNKCDSVQDLIRPINLKDERDETYRSFDETIVRIFDYMIRNQIKTIEDDKKFFCVQLGNISNKIIRLVACDFNQRIKTKTNIEFTNLMTLVYQELMHRVYDLLKQCGENNIEGCLKDPEKECERIRSHFEAVKYMQEVGNLEMFNFLINRLNEEYGNNCLLAYYKFLYQIERNEFKAAKEYIEKPHMDKYMKGQEFVDIMAIYINYQEDLNCGDKDVNALENLISSLRMQTSEHGKNNIWLWILLYCLYKKHKYLPGSEYCRWKYENLYDSPSTELPLIPISRWDIYMAHKIEFKTPKARLFYQQVDLFLNLGLYEFAEWIFDEIASETTEMEKYFMYYTFKIFIDNLESKFVPRMFPIEKLPNALYLRAILNQVNGNVEYFRNPEPFAAMKYYSTLCDLEDLPHLEHFHLGLFRYAYNMMEEKEYKKARNAFTLCILTEGFINLVAAIGKGNACYKLDDLNAAESAFAQSTEHGVYMPNVWAWLAVINLRNGENYKALECWKYAHLNADTDIDADVLEELNKINYQDVDLYIDIPEKKPS